jgi:broad specificity phosphatase PhoE
MRTIHLVRHGEVHNPEHVVYADLDGFGLSERGRRQANAAGAYLAARDIIAIVQSPLQRAVETAAIIAGAVPVPCETDDRLTEWKIGRRWAGIAWEDLPERRPGELEAYLKHPVSLPFCPEPLSTVATRVAAAIGAALERHGAHEIVFVSHQDPVQAALLTLTGESLDGLHADKPRHGEVITLTSPDTEPSGLWEVAERWAPEQGGAFPPVAGDARSPDGR